MKLFYHPASYNARRALAVARHVDAPVDVHVVDLASGAQRHPDYLELNPNGLVPSLQDGELTFWESTAIAHYLCDKMASDLVPGDAAGRADVLRWEAWGLAHLGRATDMYLNENLLKKLFGLGLPDPGVLAYAEKQFRKYAGVLDAHLEGRSWLVGDRLTLADFLVAAPLMNADMTGVPLGDFPNVAAWWKRVEALPAWQATNT